MTHTDGGQGAFGKRQQTGSRWAGVKVEDGVEFDNDPVEGFKILQAVSRSMTSNKLFRIEDPRGFVVEMPAHNLQSVIDATNIEKGSIVGKCYWSTNIAGWQLTPLGSEVDKVAKQVQKSSATSFNVGECFVGLTKDGPYKSAVSKWVGKALFKVKLVKVHTEAMRLNSHSTSFLVDADSEYIETLSEADKVVELSLMKFFTGVGEKDSRPFGVQSNVGIDIRASRKISGHILASGVEGLERQVKLFGSLEENRRELEEKVKKMVYIPNACFKTTAKKLFEAYTVGDKVKTEFNSSHAFGKVKLEPGSSLEKLIGGKRYWDISHLLGVPYSTYRYTSAGKKEFITYTIDFAGFVDEQ